MQKYAYLKLQRFLLNATNTVFVRITKFVIKKPPPITKKPIKINNLGLILSIKKTTVKQSQYSIESPHRQKSRQLKSQKIRNHAKDQLKHAFLTLYKYAYPFCILSCLFAFIFKRQKRTTTIRSIS
jgi:hypothetical protein